jgi:TonB family protein
MTLDSMIDAARASRARLDDGRRAAILDRVLDDRGGAVATPLVSEADRRPSWPRWVAVGAAGLALAAALALVIVRLGGAEDPAPRGAAPRDHERPQLPAGVPAPDDDDPPIVPRRSPRPPATEVSAQVLSANLLTGGKNIFPDDATKVKISASGVDMIAAAVALCVDTTGRVTTVEIRGDGSGYPEYDRKIIDGVRAWTFKPFLVEGVAVEVCSLVSFVYRQKD